MVDQAAIDELRELNEALSNALLEDNNDDVREYAAQLTQALRIALGPSDQPGD